MKAKLDADNGFTTGFAAIPDVFALQARFVLFWINKKPFEFCLVCVVAVLLLQEVATPWVLEERWEFTLRGQTGFPGSLNMPDPERRCLELNVMDNNGAAVCVCVREKIRDE